MEDDGSSSDEVTSTLDLLCDETMPNLAEEPVKENAPTTAEHNEYVQMLLGKEIENAAAQEHQEPPQVINKQSRTYAVNYILNARGLLEFKFETAYLAVIYLDRVLSRRQYGTRWGTQLQTMACVSLAAKMEEIDVPPLSQLPMGEYEFESRSIQRMELLVLDIMKWRMGAVTPFAFIDYLESRFCGGFVTVSLRSRTLNMILDGAKDVNLMRHRPSVIAAAAISLALERPRLTRQALELRLNDSSCSQFLNIEDVWTCCILLHEMDRERPMVSTPPSVLNLNAPAQPSSTAAVSTKRKRLGFDSDEDGDNLSDDEN